MPGSVIQNIQSLFYLSEELAKKYAVVVFLASIRFEMTKRRLQYLTFPLLMKCTESIMDLWTYKITGKICLIEIDFSSF